MDPALDPPPAAAHPAVVLPASTTSFLTAANPTSAQTASHNHPPYAEMISAAIAALKEKDGSSKRAIAKYIETQYSDLPPTHSALLTHHLKQLKASGQLLMVKHSYKLPPPGSAPAPVNGAVSVEFPDPVPVSPGAKRRPGRPPKLKPDAVQAAVPVFPPPINMNDVPVILPDAENADVEPEIAYAAAGGPANGEATATPVRGRGRPPKLGGAKRAPGRPPKTGGFSAGGGGRSRGRPRKNAAPVALRGKGSGRPRGRPPKPINVVEGMAPQTNVSDEIVAVPVDDTALPSVASVSGKRRGRPPKYGNEAKRPRNLNAAVPKSPRKLSGKPLGRPRKNAQVTGQDSQLLVAYLDLKAKLENLQSMVKQTAAFVRPTLNSEAAVNAIQELELVVANASVAPNIQSPLQLNSVQVEPQI